MAVIRAIEIARRAGRNLRGSVGALVVMEGESEEVVVVAVGVVRGLKGSGFGVCKVGGGVEGRGIERKWVSVKS